MTVRLENFIERIVSWPEEDMEKLEDAVRAIEEWRNGEYHTDDSISSAAESGSMRY